MVRLLLFETVQTSSDNDRGRESALCQNAAPLSSAKPRSSIVVESMWLFEGRPRWRPLDVCSRGSGQSTRWGTVDPELLVEYRPPCVSRGTFLTVVWLGPPGYAEDPLVDSAVLTLV